jgi:hypothetical protein
MKSQISVLKTFQFKTSSNVPMGNLPMVFETPRLSEGGVGVGVGRRSVRVEKY